MENFVTGAIEFVEQHRQFAGPIAFFFGFAETLAFLSIIIPSTAILVGVGGIVASGALDFLPIWIGGGLGAVVGSMVSYWLGRRYGDAILGIWPLKGHPELAERGRKAFAKYGILTILVGHFVGPLRAVVFLLAGVSRMNFTLFAIVDVIGSFAWAFVIPKSGELGGSVLAHIWNALFG